MDTTLAGFIGVVAGALTTGGVQTAVEWRRRRSDALAATRIVAGVLDEFLALLEDSEQSRSWAPGMRRIDARLALWDEHEQAVARAVDSFGFGRLHAAFANMRHVQFKLAEQEAQQLAPARQVEAIVSDPAHQDRLLSWRRAQCVAASAGRTLGDRITWTAWREQRLDSKVRRAFAAAEPQQVAGSAPAARSELARQPAHAPSPVGWT
jgi:hypothetical protein